MNMTAEFLLQIGVALASGIGAYTAIRADLATLHEKATNAAKTADAAHNRIDQMMRHHE
jgi:hypothetical protein